MTGRIKCDILKKNEEIIIKILTLEHGAFSINEIPEEVEDLRFCVLDNTDPKEPDYFFVPLLFLESFDAPAVVLNIGGYQVKMPIVEKKWQWQILVGDEEAKDLDLVPIEDVNDRGFDAFVYNPLVGGRPEFLEIQVDDIYQEVRWYFPRLKPGQILAVPLEFGANPKCAYFVRDISRQCQLVDFSQVW